MKATTAMNPMHALLAAEPELWRLFVKASEYELERPDRYRCHDLGTGQLVREPVVSRWLGQAGYPWPDFPEGREFAICLTHDVDDITPPWSHLALSSLCFLRRGDWRQLARWWRWRCDSARPSPYLNFEAIMEIEREYGGRSSFYVLARSEDPVRRRYELSRLGSQLRAVSAAGWEVGLHGSYFAFNRPDLIGEEKARLEDVLGATVGGYRNHYLRFQTPATWYHLQQAGFNYDTTFGYNDMPGFRNGMGHPFQPYDDHRRRAIELLEIPLHIMDSSLLTAGGSPAGAWTIIRELVEQVRSCRGVLTVLWHNDVFSCPFKQSSARLYRQLLAYGREQGAWLTSGTEIWRWATNAGLPAERSER